MDWGCRGTWKASSSNSRKEESIRIGKTNKSLSTTITSTIKIKYWI